MLKISLKQGEYVNIGDDIRVAYVGRSGNYGSFLIEAPREMAIVRNKLEQNPERKRDNYYVDAPVSKEAVKEIKRILWNDRKKAEESAGHEESKDTSEE